MNIDFPTFLVLATLLTGGLWGVYELYALRRRKHGIEPPAEHEEAKRPVIIEYSRSFFPVFLIVLLLRSFLVEPFRIPSSSMMPTLIDGDFILVNKYSYGIRLPVMDKKIIDLGVPDRGDVIVFKYPKNPAVDYIKRVVGIPGDRVAYYNKMLYINDVPVGMKEIGVSPGSRNRMSDIRIHEELLGDMQHRIQIDKSRTNEQRFEYKVKDGEYFVLGDNRDYSNDSRYWGTVPDENLVGRAFLIWMSWDSERPGIHWSRIGTVIK
jgi:signal peptidase I